MISLKDYILEAKISFEPIVSGFDAAECRRLFSKLDAWVKNNGYIYFASDSDYPGTEIQGWGENLEELLEHEYVHIDGKYARTACDISGIGCDPSKGCIYIQVNWGDKMMNWNGQHYETLPVYILADKAAEVFKAEKCGCRNSSGFRGFEDNPDSIFARHCSDSTRSFLRCVAAKKNLAKFTETEINNILK